MSGHGQPAAEPAANDAWALDDPPEHPGDLLARWLELAERSGVRFPACMTLATASVSGRPSSRTVILKRFDRDGLVFETESYSRKGTELAANPFAAVTLHWREVHRQICATGSVEVLSPETSDEMWARRPRQRQASAVASHQGAVLANEDELRARALELIASPGPIPRPPTYEARRLVPDTMEFWEGHDDRLHRRVFYERVVDAPPPGAPDWQWRRLQP